MFVLVLFTAAFVASVNAGIDYVNCETKYGDVGEGAQCSPGYLPVGMCGSGYNRDCSNGDYIMTYKCCLETTTSEITQLENKSRACYFEDDLYGTYRTCNDNYLPLGACTSGRDPECGGSSAWQRLMCCDDHNQIVTSSCNWLDFSYGVLRECGINQVIKGVCSSGTETNCNVYSPSWNSMQCCNLE